jgi:hypothetical protein
MRLYFLRLPGQWDTVHAEAVKFWFFKSSYIIIYKCQTWKKPRWPSVGDDWVCSGISGNNGVLFCAEGNEPSSHKKTQRKRKGTLFSERSRFTRQHAIWLQWYDSLKKAKV